ncbi:MAG: peptide deformylase [Candidatus Gracilibacteria bacterium]|jgi:peptide deformylase
MTLKLEKGQENKILRAVSAPISRVSAQHRTLAAEMVKTMEKEKGVGLAAPQVGRNICLIVCKLNATEKNPTYMPMVNPEILSAGAAQVEGEEGCLSLPGLWGQVKRAKSILVRFQTLKGSAQTFELTDFNARIVQHEVDHLLGVLFTDKATSVTKESRKKASANI